MVLSPPFPYSLFPLWVCQGLAPCPSPRRGQGSTSSDCHVYRVVIFFFPLSKEDVFVVSCSEGTMSKPSLFLQGDGMPFF